MFGIGFKFPFNSYHATTWGTNVNEGSVPWPPEPSRLVRALISIWFIKADKNQFPKSLLEELVDVLCSEYPVFSLPPTVKSNKTHYMPRGVDKKGKAETGKVWDTFLHVYGELVIIWKNLELTADQKKLVEFLLKRMNYFGRSESIVETRVLYDMENFKINAYPWTGTSSNWSFQSTKVLMPETPKNWKEKRPDLLKIIENEPKKAEIEDAIPESLTDALSVETSYLKKAGWDPFPAYRKVLYVIEPIEKRIRSVKKMNDTEISGRPEIARFILADYLQPKIEDAVMIGDLVRKALLSIGKNNVPDEITGKKGDDPLKKNHSHAFFLPEDANFDGKIDHILVYFRHGMSIQIRKILEKLHRLTKFDSNGNRRNWKVSLEGIRKVEDFDISSMVGSSNVWRSLTPYVMPKYINRNRFGLELQIREEIARYGGLPELKEVRPLVVEDMREFYRNKRSINFMKIRPGKEQIMKDGTGGAFIELEFAEKLQGPLAFGFNCHYGLGMFYSVR